MITIRCKCSQRPFYTDAYFSWRTFTLKANFTKLIYRFKVKLTHKHPLFFFESLVSHFLKITNTFTKLLYFTSHQTSFQKELEIRKKCRLHTTSMCEMPFKEELQVWTFSHSYISPVWTNVTMHLPYRSKSTIWMALEANRGHCSTVVVSTTVISSLQESHCNRYGMSIITLF